MKRKALIQRRSGERVGFSLPVSLETVESFLESEIMNLSKGGIFVGADIPFPLGTEVALTFHFPDGGDAVNTSGVVVWSRRRGVLPGSTFPEHPSGMGIQFRDPPMPEIDRLLDAIEGLLEKSNHSR